MRDASRDGRQRSLIRLFPKFAAGDNPNWGKVVTKARDGAPDALEAVGHHGEPTTQRRVQGSARGHQPGRHEGRELHRSSPGAPTAGRKDAVNGAVLTLLAAGNIRAAQDGKDLAGPKELPATQIGKVTLYKEDEPPTVEPAPQR